MPNSDTPLFHFTVKLSRPHPLVRIRVYDSGSNEIASAFGELKTDVPAGIYKIAVTCGPNRKEYIEGVDADETFIADLPEVWSSALIEGYSSSHEYYTVDAERYSREETCMPAGNGGSIFLFLRYPGRDTFLKSKSFGKSELLVRGLSLVDAQFNLVAEVLENTSVQNTDFGGWLAFHIALTPGNYFLRYALKEKSELYRLMPVVIADGWQTQFFCTLRDEPEFSSLRLFMSPQGTGFDSRDPQTWLTDQLYNHLSAGNRTMPPGIFPGILLPGLPRNPVQMMMLAMLLVENRQTGEAEKILMELNSAVLPQPDFPDAATLWMLVQEQHQNKEPLVVLDFPPMLRMLREAAVRLSYTIQDLIPENSPFDLLAEKSVGDGMISAFVAGENPAEEQTAMALGNWDVGSGEDISGELSRKFLFGFQTNSGVTGGKTKKQKNGPALPKKKRNTTRQSVASGSGTGVLPILNRLRAEWPLMVAFTRMVQGAIRGDTPDLVQIAAAAGLPPATLRRKLRGMSSFFPENKVALRLAASALVKIFPALPEKEETLAAIVKALEALRKMAEKE